MKWNWFASRVRSTSRSVARPTICRLSVNPLKMVLSLDLSIPPRQPVLVRLASHPLLRSA